MKISLDIIAQLYRDTIIRGIIIKDKISVVIPIYMGEPFLDELTYRLVTTLRSISNNYEIILVNDASPDASWSKISALCSKDNHIIGIDLSRNFGQHYAISAGLEYAKGQWVVVMDCDLQDLPEEITHLISKALEGYDYVLAIRMDRQDSFAKRLFSKIFYQTLSWLTGVEYDPRVANFGVYHRRVIDTIVSLGDTIRFFPAMVKWAGYRYSTLNVKHAAREQGGSTYNFSRLSNLAIDIILSYSDKPIRLLIRSGMILALLALIATIYTVIRYALGQIVVPGYASLIISIWFFSGLIMAFIGVVGLYVSKTFESVKRRPIFVVRETYNIN